MLAPWCIIQEVRQLDSVVYASSSSKLSCSGSSPFQGLLTGLHQRQIFGGSQTPWSCYPGHIEMMWQEVRHNASSWYSCFFVWFITSFWHDCWRCRQIILSPYKHWFRLFHPYCSWIMPQTFVQLWQLLGFDTYIWSKISLNLPGFAYTSTPNLKIFPRLGNIHFGGFGGVLKPWLFCMISGDGQSHLMGKLLTSTCADTPGSPKSNDQL